LGPGRKIWPGRILQDGGESGRGRLSREALNPRETCCQREKTILSSKGGKGSEVLVAGKRASGENLPATGLTALGAGMGEKN